MELVDGLRSLRACRSFQPDPIEPTMVKEWLESARWCGSSRNSQPWRFLIVTEPHLRDQLAVLGDSAAHLARAPLVIVLLAVPGPYEFSTVFDLGRVTQSLMLAAHAEGFGSCIAVFEPEENIELARQLLGVPDNLALDLAIGFGLRAEDTTEVALERGKATTRGRLPLEELMIPQAYS